MKNQGVSLIALIVTIISIIIIAGISMFSMQRTPGLANFSVFAEEVRNVQVAVGISRNENLDKFDKAEKDFKKVKIVNAPSDFITFPNVSGDTIGYHIDLSKLNYNNLGIGEGKITNDKVEFDKDDVFVYDKNGTVYYAKGFEKDAEIYYNTTVHRAKE